MGRIPGKRLLLTHIYAGAFFGCLNDLALVSFWGNLQSFAYLIKRDNRPIAEVLQDPGIFPNTWQTSHEHHFKSGIVICSIIGMRMLAMEVNEAAMRRCEGAWAIITVQFFAEFTEQLDPFQQLWLIGADSAPYIGLCQQCHIV